MTYPNIMSSYKMYDYVRSRYPNREVHSSAYLDYDDFYVATRTGKLRLFRNKKEIWVCDSIWPFIRRIR